MQTPSTMWNDIIKDAGLYNTGETHNPPVAMYLLLYSPDNSLWFTNPQPSKSLTQLFNCLHKEIDRLFSITNVSSLCVYVTRIHMQFAAPSN